MKRKIFSFVGFFFRSYYSLDKIVRDKLFSDKKKSKKKKSCKNSNTFFKFFFFYFDSIVAHVIRLAATTQVTKCKL